MNSRYFNCLIILAKIALLVGICNAQSSPIVQVKQGSVQGFLSHSLSGKEFYSFMSIPYAEPPVGKLRFKDPVPLQSWSGTVDGTKMPLYCLQYTMGEIMKPDNPNITLTGKEDCLYLNVFTPKPNDELASLPVMVYIHGGGFFSGGALEVPPNALLDKDIVLVVMQYRLGILGFLSTEDSELPGNMGLKDQRLALQWVQENIAKFGGDPNQVTLFGESAGSASVHMQMLSPGSNGLFRRIIGQSGTSLCPWASSNNHRAYAEKIGQTFNCPLENNSRDFVECLQTIDAKFLVQYMYGQALWGMAPFHVVPRIDGDFFPGNFEDILKKRKYNKVDIISGITRDEGAIINLFMIQNPELLEKLNKEFDVYGPVSALIDGKNGEEFATKVYQRYLERQVIGNIDLEKDGEKLVKLFSDRYFGACHDFTSFYLANDKKISLYRYQLDYKSPQKEFARLLSIHTENDWVSHGDDLFHIFSGPPVFIEPEVPDENDLKMREIMVTAWTNFATSGDPALPTPLGFEWQKTTLRNLKHLSLKPNATMEKFTKSESRNFWLTLAEEMENKDKNGSKVEL